MSGGQQAVNFGNTQNRYQQYQESEPGRTPPHGAYQYRDTYQRRQHPQEQGLVLGVNSAETPLAAAKGLQDPL